MLSNKSDIMRFFRGMLTRQQKEDDLEGKEAGGWSVGEEVFFNSQGEDIEIDLVFLMKFLHVGREMTWCGRLSSTVLRHPRIPPGW